MKDAILLGIIQGICEWLPVSSSGHLVLFQNIFNLKGAIEFDIFLHFSSLLIILVFLRRDVLKVCRALMKFEKNSYWFRMGIYTIFASLITGIVGFFLKEYQNLFSNLKVVSFSFLITSLLLFLSKRDGKESMTLTKALFVGFMQSIALFPGISRSGATISTAKICNIKSEEAFRFSFLIAIPAISGAIISEMDRIKLIEGKILAAGFFTSLILGFISIYILKRIVIRNKLHYFGWYCLGLSIFSFFLIK